MPPSADLIEAARDALLLASAVCRNVQQRLDQVRAMTKDDRSPVTVADFASQAVVCAVLEDHLGDEFADTPMVGEETGEYLRLPEHASHLAATVEAARQVLPDMDEERLLSLIDRGADSGEAERFWTLDPIDGTKGFLGSRQYAIALGLVQNGAPVVGVLACPNLPLDPKGSLDVADPQGSLYVAVKGDGAQELPCIPAPAAQARRLPRLEPVNDRPILACASVEKAHSNIGDAERLLRHLGGNPNPVRLDSAGKYAVVARGQADCYLRLPTRKGYVDKIWDHAAGTVVATEAGAVVTDIYGRKLDFSHGRGLEKNRGVIVAAPGAHAKIIKGIAELKIGEL